MAAVSESMLMYQMLSEVSGSRLGPMMFLMWVVRAMPAFDSESSRFWSQGCLCSLILGCSRLISPSLGYMYHTVNKDYNRLSTIKNMSKSSTYKQEILGLNLSQWIIQGWFHFPRLSSIPTIYSEFEKCRDKLRGLDLSSPYSLIWDMESPLRTTISEICDEWPTVSDSLRF
jgi:hypothetical protein